jgi:hypothetical protein
MRLPLAAILALVAAPAFAAEAPLDRLIRFRGPQFCAPARDFGRLLDSLLIARGEGFDLVRAAANAAGLKIPPTGRRVDRSELDTVIEVKRAPDGAELTCGT